LFKFLNSNVRASIGNQGESQGLQTSGVVPGLQLNIRENHPVAAKAAFEAKGVGITPIHPSHILTKQKQQA